jgi:hypothetical protein
MAAWPIDTFGHFLYNYYPGRPFKAISGAMDVLAQYRVPTFPPESTPQLIRLEMLPPAAAAVDRGPKTQDAEPDYEAQARRQKLFGDLGEKIVLEMEKARLLAARQPALADCVAKAGHDYEGFDIHSFDEDGTDRYIEVKTTQARAGNAKFFLTINEYHKAGQLANYHPKPLPPGKPARRDDACFVPGINSDDDADRKTVSFSNSDDRH